MDLLNISKNAVTEALDKLIELDKKNIKDYHFSKKLPKEFKSEADKIIEKILIDKLILSDISILSEESGLINSESNSNSNLKFIIDPIDGTANFVRDISTCAISIALFDGDQPVFGVIGSYPSGRIAWGGKGIGAFIDEMPIEVSSVKDLNNAILCTGFPVRFNFSSNKMEEQIHLMKIFAKVRMLGSASISLLQVAQGSADTYFENEIMIWDIAAGIAIIEGAGGKYIINSNENYNNPLQVIATNNIIVW